MLFHFRRTLIVHTGILADILGSTCQTLYSQISEMTEPTVQSYKTKLCNNLELSFNELCFCSQLSSFNSKGMRNDTNCQFEFLRHPRRTVTYVNLLIEANLHSTAQPLFWFVLLLYYCNFKGYTCKHGS